VVISISASVLDTYYLSKAGILQSASGTGTTSTTSSTATAAKSATASAAAAPAAPWSASTATKTAAAEATKVLAGQPFVTPTANASAAKGGDVDYQALFNTYQGLTELQSTLTQMQSNGAGSTLNTSLTSTFESGITQVSSYVNNLKLTGLRLTAGNVATVDTASEGPPSASSDDTYTTGVIYNGDGNSAVPAFAGDVQFNINVTQDNGTQVTVPIDLSQMGDTTRTMGNVVNYINSQLQGAGVLTRFATHMLPQTPQTVQVNGKTVTLPDPPEQWALKVNTEGIETVSFSAPTSAPAVYVTQTAGNVAGAAAGTASAPVQQLVKLQATDPNSSDPPPAAQVQPGSTNAVAGEAYGDTLPSVVASAKAVATGSDGSVYVVANVNGTVDGQTLQASQDVALQKYDSAGNLIYTQTLGSESSATGYALAVSANGDVAVTGSVQGALDPNDPGNGAGSDTFVSVFGSNGDEQWTRLANNPIANQGDAVAFGSDGSVYVAGQSNGGAQGFLTGYSAKGAQQFSVSTGAGPATSLAVDGSTVIVGGVQGGDGVLQNYTLQSSGAPTLTATRNLGNLQGGTISGVAIDNGQVVVAGNTANGDLSAGTVNTAASGTGQNAFVAQVSEDLTASSSDQITYLGGTGTTTVAGLAVSNGQAYITGSSTGGLPGVTNLGTVEGYAASIDLSSGAVSWSQSFNGQSGYDAPEGIAVSQGGASVLDRLGLPTGGAILQPTTDLLTTSTSVRAGDQFQIGTSQGGPLTTITIDADDTPATLATKIERATGYRVTASVTTTNGVSALTIKAANAQTAFEILPGASGKNALAALGLKAGVIQTGTALNTPGGTKSATTGPAKNTYGLGLTTSFNLTTKSGLQSAQNVITAAIAEVKTAYSALANPSTSTTKAGTTNTSSSGKAPAYLTAELSNYQQGLYRLTGSTTGTSSTSTTSAGVALSLLT
jgi:hypothetical protein